MYLLVRECGERHTPSQVKTGALCHLKSDHKNKNKKLVTLTSFDQPHHFIHIATPQRRPSRRPGRGVRVGRRARGHVCGTRGVAHSRLVVTARRGRKQRVDRQRKRDVRVGHRGCGRWSRASVTTRQRGPRRQRPRGRSPPHPAARPGRTRQTAHSRQLCPCRPRSSAAAADARRVAARALGAGALDRQRLATAHRLQVAPEADAWQSLDRAVCRPARQRSRRQPEWRPRRVHPPHSQLLRRWPPPPQL